MRSNRLAIAVIAAAAALAALAAVPGLAAPGETTRVSVSSDGTQGNSVSGFFVSVSGDGRFVAFRSISSNLVPGDTNGDSDIFVRDRSAGTTERVTVTSASAQVFGFHTSPAISASGRFVAFYSESPGLVPGDTNGAGDIFVRDRTTGTTERVNVASDGLQVDAFSFSPSISADGRYVAFSSFGTNLVPGDTNGGGDIFVRDRLAGTTERVSLAWDGTQGNSHSQFGAISADGRFVVFESDASNLVPGDTNNTTDVFLRDRQAGTTERISIAADGSWGNQRSDSAGADNQISADGRFVIFNSYATNLVPGDNPAASDIFLRDRLLGMTTQISVASDGTRGNGQSAGASISADGRLVAFASRASNLVPGDTNDCVDADGGHFNCEDIFVRDRVAGTTQRASLSSSGEQAAGRSQSVALSADGRFVAFDSTAPNLVPGDTNGLSDIFVRELGIKAASSLALNGTTAYGEAPDAPELNPASWTFEVWFKDANPTYSHPRTRILTKGDIALGEVPYFASIDSNVLYVGARSGGQANVVTIDLATSSPLVTPNAWHHLAATFDAGTRALTVYLDGVPRGKQVLSFGSTSNTAPLIVGRSGAAGDYWRGKLDDLRIWNVVRTAAEISANYRTQFTTPPAGLVGSWRFDEGSGSTAFDKAGSSMQNMSLLGGAGYSAEVP